MIRVGIVFEQDGSWLGGVNYYRNLLSAVDALPARQIEPVIFLSTRAASAAQMGFPPFEVVRNKMLDRHSLYWWLRKLLAKASGRDWLLQQLLQRNDIRVLSHSGSLGQEILSKRSKIPCLCWMADFQHKHLPQFFEPWEIRVRDGLVQKWQHECAAIVFSSEDARKDMLHFFAQGTAKLEVLPFVSEVAAAADPAAEQAVLEQYALPEKYFLVANQFWAHKNHQAIVEALALLKQSGKAVRVVASGNPADYRQSGHYEKLMERVREAGLQQMFQVVGVIPFAQLSVLMRHAVAMINPSLFEGWNTSVEEAKSLGKQVLLSDIAVHREQNPQRGFYFAPNDAGRLAELMWSMHGEFDSQAEMAAMQQAAHQFPARQREFGAQYQAMVLRTANINY